MQNNISTNRIDTCMNDLIARGKKALVACLIAGDPDLETTKQTVLEMFAQGADIISLSVPFSDPIAESPNLQKSSLRSLEAGTTPDKIFDIIRELRTQTDKPLLLSLYINTVFAYGTDLFFKTCAEVGIDGVTVPDLPYEERDEVDAFAEAYNIYYLPTVAPAPQERIQTISANAKGFLYCLKNALPQSTCPRCLNIDSIAPEQFQNAIAPYEGITTEDSIVKIMEAYKYDAPKKAGEFIRSLILQCRN